MLQATCIGVDREFSLFSSITGFRAQMTWYFLQTDLEKTEISILIQDAQDFLRIAMSCSEGHEGLQKLKLRLDEITEEFRVTSIKLRKISP